MARLVRAIMGRELKDHRSIGKGFEAACLASFSRSMRPAHRQPKSSPGATWYEDCAISCQKQNIVLRIFLHQIEGVLAPAIRVSGAGERSTPKDGKSYFDRS